MDIFYPLATETWDDHEYKALQSVIDSGRFTMGRRVKRYEEDFARYFGARYAVMVNSGSSANLLSVAACVFDPRQFLKPGDTVLVPAVSWSTTFFPLQQYGLHLRFVDIDPDTLNLDEALLEQALTPETKAVFAVNLLGNPCNFEVLQNFCAAHDLVLLEDNCESMGATYNGKQAGTFGLCGTYSSYFSHHISTMEGGMIVTDDEMIYHSLLSLRAHGWTREQPAHSHLQSDDDPFSQLFRFVLPGYNVRPLEMSGALGVEQLKKLAVMVEKRRDNAKLFQSMFADVDDITIQTETGESAWFGFAMTLGGRLAGKRAALVSALQARGIECRPIVTGNFLNNPVIKHIDYSLGSEIIHAEQVDKNGLFFGNHHYDIREQLQALHDLISEFKANI